MPIFAYRYPFLPSDPHPPSHLPPPSGKKTNVNPHSTNPLPNATMCLLSQKQINTCGKITELPN
jgi:hypothetical protein